VSTARHILTSRKDDEYEIKKETRRTRRLSL